MNNEKTCNKFRSSKYTNEKPVEIPILKKYCLSLLGIELVTLRSAHPTELLRMLDDQPTSFVV